MLARSAADLENFKKRTERDKTDTMFYKRAVAITAGERDPLDVNSLES